MKDIRLEMSLDEANLILEGLGHLPFIKVYELISKVQRQAKSCLEPPPAPTAPPALESDLLPTGQESASPSEPGPALTQGPTRNDVRLQDIFPEKKSQTPGLELPSEPEEISHVS